MTACYPLVPLFANQALGIALFSYDGRLYWGFNADWDAIPDLHELVEAVERELAVIVSLGTMATGAPARRGGDRLVSGRPPVDGFVHPDFMPVAQALRGQLASHHGGAARVRVSSRAVRGRPVGRLSATRPAARGSATRCRRASPPPRASPRPSLHVMVDRGLLDYDAASPTTGPSSRRRGRSASRSATCWRTSRASTTSGG